MVGSRTLPFLVERDSDRYPFWNTHTREISMRLWSPDSDNPMNSTNPMPVLDINFKISDPDTTTEDLLSVVV
ncbi:14860_t:CDS:1, partial [Dentiscutata erythropus]